MARGPKTKPDRLKVLKGTLRGKKPTATSQASEELSFPGWLPENCREHFDVIKARLQEHGLDSASWTEAAALIAMRLHEIDECNGIIKAEGRTYKATGTSGQELTKVNPIVAQKNEAMRHLQSLLAEFGLTPAAVAKVGRADSEANSDPWGGF